MLKFLDNRSDAHKNKLPMAFKPGMVYGISIQAPESFQNAHTIVNNDTYLNVHLDFDENRKKKLSNLQIQELRRKWIQKVSCDKLKKRNFSFHDQQNQANMKMDAKTRCEALQEGLNKNPSLYRIKSGYFTDFMDQNKFYQVLGPLHGNERMQKSKNQDLMGSKLRIKNSHLRTESQSKTIHQSEEPGRSIFKQTSKSKFELSKKSSNKSLNAFNEKNRIGKSRKTLKNSFLQTIQRQKEKNVERFYKKKKLPHIVSFYSQRQELKRSQFIEPTGLEDLQSFQNKLLMKFK